MEISKEQLAKAAQQIAKVYAHPTARGVEGIIASLRGSLPAATSPVVRRLDQIPSTPRNFITLGVPWLDSWIQGIRRKEVVLVAGIPFSGKTHMLQFLSSKFAMKSMNVVYFFGEDLIDDHRDNFKAALQSAPALFKHIFLVDMDNRFRVEDMEIALSALRAKGIIPDVVVSDHLDLMNPTGVHREDWRAAEEIVTDVKFMAKRENVIFLTASQKIFDQTQTGASSLYRSKTGKAGNVDVMFIIRNTSALPNGNILYDVGLEKGRGRKIMPGTHKLLSCDWVSMTIVEEVGREVFVPPVPIPMRR